jgi:cholesterol transport system auxiliary component
MSPPGRPKGSCRRAQHEGIPVSALTPRQRGACSSGLRAPAGRIVRATVAALMLVLMAGCAGTLLPKPPASPARFTLDNGQAAQPAGGVLPAAARTLVVARPRPAPGYDSTRMVYLRRAQELESFAFHEWVEPPAQMLAPLLLRALQDSGAFRAVLLAPSAASGAWQLETELIRLHQDFSRTPSQVRLTLRAVLVDSASRQVVAWREFDQQVAAVSDDPTGGVAAAREATQQMLVALAAFASEQAAR